MRRLFRFIALAASLAAFPAYAQERQVYSLPQGAHPHDVAPAPDGDIWYTAQRQGALGILDPETGNEGSSPHGVIQGPDGDAWITDGGLNAIVRFDSTTEEIKVWALPQDVGYANLNTAAFDGDGLLWFTGQSGIYGRLDPETGDMKIFHAPEGRGPYGITATPNGDVYFVSLAGSYLASIDRKSGEPRVIEPPTPDQGARRVWSDSRGRLWVSEWNAGQVSVYDPHDGGWNAWRLPGDLPRTYAVYVDERDIVWLSDFGGNAVHAFDPQTDKFTTYPKSTENADVRQINGRRGEVWLPESGADRLVVIRTVSAK
ncbi:hydrolase [Mesorhizobium tianshanense]|uniref:Virginiamycin B lyase n=1 Tax=Mesorhizobium tianshanense TaxID=39844 RepID=A0A562P4A0_9HYPH|nr:lyase [Mesorhizobium tianshanense]TWI38816.1 virginiamycin B lyase [Mesorhizobium tianshanense]GLS38153.1 hydrolase [Mesorhizobium tianshanense]